MVEACEEGEEGVEEGVGGGEIEPAEEGGVEEREGRHVAMGLSGAV